MKDQDPLSKESLKENLKNMVYGFLGFGVLLIIALAVDPLISDHNTNTQLRQETKSNPYEKKLRECDRITSSNIDLNNPKVRECADFYNFLDEEARNSYIDQQCSGPVCY